MRKNNYLTGLLLFLTCVYSAAPVFAADNSKVVESVAQHGGKDDESAPSKQAPPVNRWKDSQIQLGFVNNTGNSETTNLSLGIDIIYENAPYRNDFATAIQFNSSNGETSKERYSVTDQLNYSFDTEKLNYAFLKSQFVSDRFNPYRYQGVTVVGYGHELYKSDRLTWALQAGPGVRFNQLDSEPKMHTNVIASTQSKLSWHISDSFTFSQSVLADFSAPYQYLEAKTAMTNKIIHNLALQFSYTVEYYSRIPRGSSNDKNMDTVTNIALVYSF